MIFLPREEAHFSSNVHDFFGSDKVIIISANCTGALNPLPTPGTFRFFRGQ